MIRIEKARKKDAPYISLLGRVTFNETFGHLFQNKNDLLAYDQRTFSVQKIRHSLDKTENRFWLAYVDDLPVGYAKLKLDSPSRFIAGEHLAQLQKIYVLNDFLSLKIGQQLQQTVVQTAIASGAPKIWLSVLKSNKRAINFYLKNNFKTIGEHTFQIGEMVFNFQAMARSLG
ncbi:MAG: GNAT family N-acetyltransferase [Bacteroidota bacterium]